MARLKAVISLGRSNAGSDRPKKGWQVAGVTGLTPFNDFSALHLQTNLSAVWQPIGILGAFTNLLSAQKEAAAHDGDARDSTGELDDHSLAARADNGYGGSR